jgi:hypothetical protein
LCLALALPANARVIATYAGVTMVAPPGRAARADHIALLPRVSFPLSPAPRPPGRLPRRCRVDGVDDVPPWPQTVENAAPRAVRIRLAWDSLTAARPLHTSSIARPSGVGLYALRHRPDPYKSDRCHSILTKLRSTVHVMNRPAARQGSRPHPGPPPRRRACRASVHTPPCPSRRRPPP